MVSNTDVGEDEGWGHVDKLGDDVCAPPVKGDFFPGKVLPTFVHFCQWFRMGEFGFQKRRITNLKPFSCEGPMMQDIPRNINHAGYVTIDGKNETGWAPKKINRNAYAVCAIHQGINLAVVDFKKRMCTDPEHPPTFHKVINGVRNDNW